VLKGSTRIVDLGPSFQMRRLEGCDVTSVRSQSRDVIDDVTNRRALGTFLQSPYWPWTPRSLSFRDI